ncbi:MAG: mevalonate kinase [Acidilobaceae archaeon]|nr:mevalonate kinase [Acidilobaceae archaeon]
MIEASAPGKVILFGEHFVVKGSRAIATAVDLRARARAERAERGISIDSANLGSSARLSLDLSGTYGPEMAPYVAVLRALRERGYSLIPHRALLTSEMPLSAGLGSSAASSVAYALAYSALHGSPLGERELFEVSLEGERVAHGNPSGIDNAIAVKGGTVVYRRGEAPREVEVRLGGHSLIIVDSGEKRSTREAVEGVLRLADRHWRALEKLYLAADAIVEEAIALLSAGDAEGLGELMNVNHGLLSAVGVSTAKLDLIAHELRRAGALGAKLTGAGRGGCVIAIAQAGRAQRIAEHVKGLGYEAFLSGLGAPGARLETI